MIKATHHKDSVETLIYLSATIEKSIKKKYTYDNKAYWDLVKEDNIGISRHIKKIYADAELNPATTVAKIATVVNRGIRGKVDDELDYYNLDMIIAVDEMIL